MRARPPSAPAVLTPSTRQARAALQEPAITCASHGGQRAVSSSAQGGLYTAATNAPQRLRRQWPLRARAAAVAPPTNNYPERFAGPAQNLPAVPAQATTRPPKDARRTYLEGAQINHGSGPAPRPARRLRPLRIATARHGEHRVRVHAANIGTGGSRSRGNLRATPVMVIKADGTACRT